MGKVDIKIPEELGADDEEAVIASWLGEDGEYVTEGDLICEIMVSKTTIELMAPASGTLHANAEAETVVMPGQVIGQIET